MRILWLTFMSHSFLWNMRTWAPLLKSWSTSPTLGEHTHASWPLSSRMVKSLRCMP